MKEITKIGLDTAKSVFHIIGQDQHGNERLKRKLSRAQVHRFFANTPACVVALEACACSQYWAQQLQQYGHTVRLLPPQHVKRYLIGQKNDYNDARAILAASARRDIHPVRIKSPDEQEKQTLDAMRRHVRNEKRKTAAHIRALLTEYGLVFATGIPALKRGIVRVLSETDSPLSMPVRHGLQRQYERLQQWEEDLVFYDNLLKQVMAQDVGYHRIQQIPGIGPITATRYRIVIGDGKHITKGRSAGVMIGLTPKHHGTGGKNTNSRITKQGDTELRSLLVHGARAVVSRAQGKDDPLSRWIQQLEQRVGRNKATVAYANKMARMAWALLARDQDYDPTRASRYPAAVAQQMPMTH